MTDAVNADNVNEMLCSIRPAGGRADYTVQFSQEGLLESSCCLNTETASIKTHITCTSQQFDMFSCTFVFPLSFMSIISIINCLSFISL